jgi:hypothetical protein
MNPLIRPLIILLVALAGLLFLSAIVLAGVYTLNNIKNFPAFFSNAVVVIGGILSTNLGAVLGVTLVPPQAQNRTIKFLGLRSTIQHNSVAAATSTTVPPTASQKFQIIACWVYVVGLLIAAVFYFIAISKPIPDNDMVNLIPSLSKTLLGVIVGAITVALGKN